MRRHIPLDLESTGSLFAISHETYLYLFPNLAPFAPLREANSSPFSRSKYSKIETATCSLVRCSEIPDDTLTYRRAAPCVPLGDSAGSSLARTNAIRLS